MIPAVPFPDPAMISLLSGLPALADLDGRVSTELDSVFPCARITHTHDLEPATDFEATPIYQVEIWSDDEFQAGSLAWALRSAWPVYTRQVVGDALVSARFIDLNPHPSPDPETRKPRYLVSLGIRLSGAVHE